MSKRLLLSAASAIFALTAFATAASALNLHTQRGYRELGGRIALDFENTFPHDKKAVDSQSGGHFYLSPTFGYFFMDNFELNLEFELGLPFGDLYEKSDTTVGFGVGLQYIIALGSPIRPYVGLLLGMDFSVPDDSKADTTKFFNVTGQLGIMIPLFNEHVALDLGLRLQGKIDLNDHLEDAQRSDRLIVPLGYLGVRSFW